MGENDHKALAAKAREIYYEQLKQTLEASSRGQFVAIEANSGDYFLGSTPLEAINNGKQRYPKRFFHVMRIGYKAAVLIKHFAAYPSDVIGNLTRREIYEYL
jgi:hypothetical protein